MALTTANLTVGAGRIFTAPIGTALPDFDNAAATNAGDTANDTSLVDSFNDAGNDWVELGLTADGIEVGYEPTYNDIMVDQYKDAGKVFLAQETFTLRTTLMETTLENLVLAWGRSNASLSAPDATTGAVTFSMGIGPDQACEYQVAVIGNAPGSTLDCADPANDNIVERLYVAYRAISVEGSTHSLSREESTMFPVTFRLLPYDAAPGSEYGQITDRLIQPIV